MAQIFSNVMDYKVVANNGFQFNVKVNGVNNLGNRKWMLRAVEVIRDYFTFTEGADEGLIVNVVVNTHEIIVKAEFNEKKYFTLPIQPRYGKNQIKDILDNMGVVKDVIDVYTNNMVNSNNMEENEENEDIDYLVTIFNEKMVEDISKDFESTLQNIAEYGDISGENEYVCGDFNYERDYEHEWVEFYNENGNGGINHAYEIFRNASSFTSVDFFNEDDACYLVYELEDTYGVGVEDNCCEECLVWVKNPYYVDEDSPKNDSPCLDENKYNVIARCSDGNVKIGMDGVYDFTLDVAKEVAYEHTNMGVTLMIVKVEE